jgi:hypothetical protein
MGEAAGSAGGAAGGGGVWFFPGMTESYPISGPG